MWYRYSKRFAICMTLFMLWSPASAMVNSEKPLKPMDLSSPRATLSSFFKVSDDILQHWNDIFQSKSNRAAIEGQHARAKKLERILDLSEIPPAARFDYGRDGLIYLYEALSRIELPSEMDIPDAAAYAQADNDKKADDKTISWTIPDTEITLVRIEDEQHSAQFVFSSSTVSRAKEFYEKTRSLPYLRDVPVKNYVEMRSYLSMNGWMISAGTIEAFPDWLKHSIYNQAVWKWITLVVLIVMIFMLALIVRSLLQHRLSKNPTYNHLSSLVTPLILLLMPLALDLANEQLTLTGQVSGNLMMVSAAITYILFAWIAWAGLVVISDAVIASPKINERSLNASLLRLIFRMFAVMMVIAIILYVSSQLGVPLYGLIAGLGVGGIAIALAAQPTIENFIGSLNLFADKPVRIGDFCRYGDDPSPDVKRIGTVEAIGIRSTKIRGIDSSITTIPNSDFSNMHIINYTRRNRILLFMILGLRYETTDDQLRFVITMLRDMLLAHPRVVDEEPRVHFSGFGDFAFNVEIRVNINTSDRDEFREIREDINFRIIKIVNDAGTSFAFPSSTVYHSYDDGIDEQRQQAAEKQVRNWCSAQELPFPHFSFEHRKKTRNTLDYPPEGSPESSE